MGGLGCAATLWAVISPFARLAIVGTSLTVGVVGLAAVAYVQRTIAPEPSSRPQVQEVEHRGAIVAPNEGRGYPGLIVSRDTVDVSPELEGKLEEVPVRLGQRVKRGELLATLNIDPVRQQLAMAEAKRGGAEADLGRAVLEHQQAADQLAVEEKISGHLSRVELSTARYQEQIAASRVASAQALLREQRNQVSQLRQSVSHASLRAPFDGLVSERYAAVGAVVGRNSPIIRLVGTEDLRVRFAVPEKEARSVTLGIKVRVGLGPSASPVFGMVEHLSPEIDPASRSLFVEARLEASPEVLAQIPSGHAARVFLSAPADGGR